MPLRIRQLLGFLTYYLSFGYYLLLLPLFDRWETEERFRKRLKKATRISMRMFGVTVKMHGHEHISRDTNKILIANHSSWFDQLALIDSVDVPLAFMTNAKYFKYWGLSRVLQKMGSVPVIGRDIHKSLAASRATLEAENWLVIYPEGTRSSSLLPFRRGAALLAQQTGVPLQPVLIDGAEDVLPRRKSLLGVRPGVIKLTILPPISKPDAISTKACMEQIQACFAAQPRTVSEIVETGSLENMEMMPDAPEANFPESDFGKVPPEIVAGTGTTPEVMKVRQPLITESEPAQTIPSGSGTTSVAEHTKQCDLQSSSSNEKTRYPVDLETLQPSNWLGMFYMLYATLMTFMSVVMSLSENPWMWLAGQVLLAITLIQWFAILHEAGHKTMFKTRWLNRWVCHVSGAFALIPGDCWRLVHAKHHYWTGWQDLDVTTETLVPRELRTFERITINTCWRLWIPLFASLYRWNNYWNLPRLRNMFQRPNQKRLVTVNILVYLLLYTVLIMIVGFSEILAICGLALLISFALQDLLILSQHTHIPMKLSQGATVRPFNPAQQEVFTRSLIFPNWFARLVLLNFDAHGLHHILPRVPGYHLHRLQSTETLNCIQWWKWIVAAKSVPGEILLFQNRDQTGFHF